MYHSGKKNIFVFGEYFGPATIFHAFFYFHLLTHYLIKNAKGSRNYGHIYSIHFKKLYLKYCKNLKTNFRNCINAISEIGGSKI